jgi:hypothetical protein
VIDALDKTLIPGATNAELKALLIKVRPAFVAHRDHAKSLLRVNSHRESLGRTPYELPANSITSAPTIR